jgi:preprotein translocase subunit SecA
MSLITKIIGTHSSREVKKYGKIVAQINDLERHMATLSHDELRLKTTELKEKIAKSQSEGKTLAESLNLILPEAFAVVRETAKRIRNERHHDVQLIGGLILHDGKIAELKTGEGKTLMATLPAYLNALSGRGVHVITVNDYLARRDAVWMSEIYSFLGLTVGVVNDDMSYLYDPLHINEENPPADEVKLDKERIDTGSYKVKYEFLRPCNRPQAYAADITYGTNSQFGFDYLRDNLEKSIAGLRQRDFNYAIVDEVDSILIDEARTPLIIAIPFADSDDFYTTFSKIARKMNRDEHFTVDEKFKTVAINDAGIDLAEKELNIGNIYSEGGIKFVHHLENAIRAKSLYTKDVEYVVKDGQVIIVDPSTGRLQPGRRWSEGLHQAIEAKEGVKINQETRAYASITYQNYFRLYPKLAGMTGTALTSSEEFLKVYGLDVIEVPTHRPIARVDHADLMFQSEKGKFIAIARKIKELNQKGQPVLVGTASIEKNELLSQYLKKEGIPHALLNAKPEFAEREGEIVAQAGKKGAVTIATNMAGRGVDIKLGGVPVSAEKYEEVKSLGGLFVLGTERHEARRIDNQLRGRSGRQGDPGESQFFVSFDDNLMRIFASDTIKSMMAKLKIPEDEAITNGIVSRALESAQSRIEGMHFDSRRHVLEYDDVLNQQRKKIYDRRRRILIGDHSVISEELEKILKIATPTQIEDINKKRESMGNTDFLSTTRGVILQTIDLFWVDHLEIMDYTRSSVGLRAYGQRDPLVEYKREALRLFKQLESGIDGEVLRALQRVTTMVGVGEMFKTIDLKPDSNSYNPITGEISNNIKGMKGKDGQILKVINPPTGGAIQSGSLGGAFEKVGRNDPCPCGSGKKYKKCHGA